MEEIVDKEREDDDDEVDWTLAELLLDWELVLLTEEEDDSEDEELERVLDRDVVLLCEDDEDDREELKVGVLEGLLLVVDCVVVVIVEDWDEEVELWMLELLLCVDKLDPEVDVEVWS